MDMVVNLLDKRINEPCAAAEGIRVLRPLTPNKGRVLQFIRDTFGEGWANEAETAFSRQPVSCFIAVNEANEVVGFSAYECTNRNFFGPTGVRADYRKKGIGRALLLLALRGLRDMGYVYAIIGGVEQHNFAFYSSVCGAQCIEGSEPGIYIDLL